MHRYNFVVISLDENLNKEFVEMYLFTRKILFCSPNESFFDLARLKLLFCEKIKCLRMEEE